MVAPMTGQRDVPSPIDLRSMNDARQWAESAMAKRPWRTDFFDTIAHAIPPRQVKVLELGSGPGFLAERLVQNMRIFRMHCSEFLPRHAHSRTKSLGTNRAGAIP